MIREQKPLFIITIRTIVIGNLNAMIIADEWVRSYKSARIRIYCKYVWNLFRICLES